MHAAKVKFMRLPYEKHMNYIVNLKFFLHLQHENLIILSQ